MYNVLLWCTCLCSFDTLFLSINIFANSHLLYMYFLCRLENVVINILNSMELIVSLPILGCVLMIEKWSHRQTQHKQAENKHCGFLVLNLPSPFDHE